MKSNICLALAMLFVSAAFINLASASTSVSLAANSAFDAGQTILFNVSISGGTGVYTVQIYNVTSGVVPLGSTFQVTAGGSNTMSITAGATGSFLYNAVATNSTSNTFASNTKGITVSAALGTPSAPTASNATLDIGQSQTISVPAVSGGTSPVMYNFTVSYSSNGVITRSSGPQASTSYTYSPVNAGTAQANVIVTDSATLPQKTVSPYGSTVTRYATPTAVLTPNSPSISSGGSVVYNVLISNGKGPFTVNLVSSNGMVVQSVSGASQGVTTFSAFAPPSGSDSFNAVAADSTSTPFVFASASNTITVGSLGSGGPLTVNSFCFSSTCTGIKADAGQTLQLVASVSGGTGPYSYNYIVYNSTGAVAASAVHSNSTSDAYSFSVPGSAGGGAFKANLTVTDSASNTAKGTQIAFTINAMPSVTIMPSNAVLYIGSAEIYSASLSRGTGPFNVKLEYASNSTTVANTSKTGVPAGTVNMVFTPKLGTTAYLAVATDTGTTSPYVYASASNTTKVVNAPTVSISANSTSVNTTVLFNVSIPASVGAGPFQVGIRKGATNLTVHTIPAGGGFFTYKYVSGSAGSISFKVVGVDQGISPNYFFSSSNVTVSFGGAGASTTSTTTISATTTATGGGGGSSTAASSSTTAKSSSTTVSGSKSTIITSTTTIPIANTVKVTKSSMNVTLNISSGSPAAINFTNANTLIAFFTNASTLTGANVMVANNTATSPALVNYTKLFTISVNTVTTASTTVNVIASYPCSLNVSRVRPYKLYSNGTWVAITPVIQNPIACTLSFTIPKDPTVGLFLAPAPASIPLPPVNSALDVYGVIIVIVVVVVIVIAAAFYFKRKAPNRNQKP